MEDLKAKNAAVVKENSQIKNLNADLLKAREDNKDKNYAEADALMSRDARAKPDAAVLWVELGLAQKGLKKYEDAATSLQKAVELDSASKKPNPDLQAVAEMSWAKRCRDRQGSRGPGCLRGRRHRPTPNRGDALR